MERVQASLMMLQKYPSTFQSASVSVNCARLVITEVQFDEMSISRRRAVARGARARSSTLQGHPQPEDLQASARASDPTSAQYCHSLSNLSLLQIAMAKFDRYGPAGDLPGPRPAREETEEWTAKLAVARVQGGTRCASVDDGMHASRLPGVTQELSTATARRCPLCRNADAGARHGIWEHVGEAPD